MVNKFTRSKMDSDQEISGFQAPVCNLHVFPKLPNNYGGL